MKEARFYRIKDEIRILGLDDGPFKRGDEKTLLVGTIFRGGSFLDGVVSTEVEVDGLDATEKVVQLITKCKFRDLRVVMLDGLGFGGFNLVDIKRVCDEAGLPVIAVVRDFPDFGEIDKALDNLDDKRKRLEIIKNAGEPRRVETRRGKFIFMQHNGINEDDAEEIVKLSSTRSLIPEPIRVAHLIAQGIVLGESRGKA